MVKLSDADEVEYSRLQAMVQECYKQIRDIQDQALASGVKLKEVSKDPRLEPARQLARRCGEASYKILSRSYKNV